MTPVRSLGLGANYLLTQFSEGAGELAGGYTVHGLLRVRSDAFLVHESFPLLC